MPSSNFYPSVSELLPIDKIPSSLGPVKDGIQNVFSKIFYKDLISEVSQNGDSGFYKLTLLSYGRLGFDVPGTGLSILFNPDDTSASVTPIPITLKYDWEVIKYINEFKTALFSADAGAFFNLFLEIIDVEKAEFVEEVIDVFIKEPNPVAKFVNDFNSKYNPSPLIVISTDPESNVFEGLMIQIEAQGFDVNLIIFNDFINVLNSFDEVFENLKALFKKWFGEFTLDDFKKILLPKAALTINNLSAGIEFPRSVFVPVATTTFNPTGVVIGDPVPDPYKTLLKFNVGSVAFSTENGYEFIGENSFTFQKSFILGTRFTLSLTDMKLDFSRTKNIQEAIDDGRPADFIGVYVKEGVVGFPAEWGHNPAGSTGELFVNNLLAGTGGISGTIGLRGKPDPMNPGNPYLNPLISVKFGEKFIAELDAFSITFYQNAIVESEILGKLKIPGFKDAGGADAEIEIKIHIDGNGDFYITAKEENGITLPLHFDKYFTVTVNSLTIGRRSNKFFLAVSGAVDFKDLSADNAFLGSLLPKEIEIQKLLIWENGQIELEGGTIELRKPVKINLGPVKLTVTAIGMGSYERMHGGSLRKYKYVEFSAGVSINPGGVDARGDGIKVYFSIDGGSTDIFVRIESIAIDLIMPGHASKDQATLLLNGYLSMKEPSSGTSDAGTEYAGGIDFKLPKLKMGGSASMKYNPKTPAFLIDVSLEISTPIVLGATGMGIYGFRALFGKHYVVSRTEPPVSLAADAEWWQYYKKKVNPEMKEGVTTSKMANLDGFSFGAGVSLATATDGGKAFSSKLFFLLSLPEVFLLQGQAQILKGRIGLDTTEDPPFYAIIAIDKTSISAGLGVTYKFPDDGASPGKIATVDALIEMAYFWHDSSAWYLNIGRDQPADRRVRARIFDLFDVYSYFMLSAHGIRAGAGASLEKNYKVGPIKARLYAYMDTAGRLAFKPVQIGGSIDIGGGVDIKVCGKGFSLTANASLAAEAPKPFIVTGSVEVCVKVLKKEYCINLDFTWTFEHSLDFSEIPMVTESLLDPPGTPVVSTRLQKAVKALNMMSQDSLNLLCLERIPVTGSSASSIPPLTDPVWSGIDNYILPLDSFIDLEFRKPVKPVGHSSLTRFGGVTSGPNYSVYVAPQRGKSNRVRHDFVLDKVEIFNWNPTTNTWDDYHVYNAITPLGAAPFNLTSAALDNLQFGFWQVDSPGYYTKLRLMAQNPLSFLGQGTGDTVAEDLGVTNGIFCPPEERDKTCVNYDSYRLKTGQNKLIPATEIIQQQSVLMRVITRDSAVIYKPYAGIHNALAFLDTDTLEIYLPEPMVEVSMLLNTLTSALTIKYYSRSQVGLNASGDPVYGYALVGTAVKTPAQLAGGVLYSDSLNPIDKIEITGGSCNLKERNIVCDTTMSGEANDFIKLMNLIAKFREITRDIKLGDDPRYSSTVAGSTFFPTPTPKGLFYHPVTNSTTLTITFSGQGYDCQVVLNVPQGKKIDWNLISRFQNLRPDPAHASTAGGNYFFLVDVLLQDGTIMTLSGASKCLPVYYCYDKCLNFFYQLCYLNVVDYQYNQSLPSSTDVAQNNSNMVDAINKTLLPVWRPDTVFAVRVQYTDQLFEESSSHPSVPRAFVFGFRTKGPIGHYHEYPTGDNTSTQQGFYHAMELSDTEDQFKLASLKYYIDYSKSYPNADGNILNAKPLYYQNPELLLFYVFPYVYQFYQDWDPYNGTGAVGSSLEVLIKDPIEPPFVTDPMNPMGPEIANVVPPANNEWQINSFPVITPDIAAINNMIQNGVTNGNPCLPSVVPLTPNGINNLVTPATPLEPLKLYTAVYLASYKPATVTLTKPQKREVHKYGFQTSRYKDFNEHISSYILQQNAITMAIEKAAVYELKKTYAPLLIIKAKQTLDGTLPKTDSLHQEAAINFDKLVDRVFELKELEPAEYLQFNLVIDSTTDNVLGILLRSPEPFNDPKTPLVELNSTIRMEVDMGSGYGAATDHVVHFSKDRASAFITNADNSLDVPRGISRFTFTYKLYNGSLYVVRATEQVVLDFNAIL
ncbi:MAG: hypothetical protein JWO44_1236 [Bacteroidetes bacterium]|nr:hypothetical protein [Bacteroidota bacterium]